MNDKGAILSVYFEHLIPISLEVLHVDWIIETQESLAFFIDVPNFELDVCEVQVLLRVDNITSDHDSALKDFFER